ncbi:MAG: glycosyltransferase family 4 protein [Candidatus Brocadiia bacterium]
MLTNSGNRRRKIVYVITRLIRGGAQKVCFDIIASLKDKYDITLISGTETGVEGSLWVEFKSISNINIRQLAQLVRGIAPFKDTIALIRLYWFFRSYNPDVVHCHTSKAGFLGCLAAKLTGVPNIIWSPHGHIFSADAQIPQVTGLSMSIFYWFWKLTCWCSNTVIALTESDKKDQVMLGLAPDKKFRVVYNGLDALVNGADKIPEIKGQPILGVIGRLSPEKGQEYLLKAISILKPQYPQINLLVVGDGGQRKYLHSVSEQLQITSLVTFTGLVENIHPFVSKMDIVVLPSLYESFGLVLLEAMAMKKPVIASNVNGIPEIVENGKSGILVAPRDAQALAVAIQKLIDNPVLANTMGQNGFDRFIKLFTREQMIVKIKTIYGH